LTSSPTLACRYGYPYGYGYGYGYGYLYRRKVGDSYFLRVMPDPQYFLRPYSLQTERLSPPVQRLNSSYI